MVIKYRNPKTGRAMSKADFEALGQPNKEAREITKEIKEDLGKPEYLQPTEIITRTAPADKIQEFAVGAILNTDKGNQFAIVMEATIKRGRETETTYHVIIQDSPRITAKSKKLVNERLRMNYGVESVTIKPLKTIDRLTGVPLTPAQIRKFR